MSETLSHDVQTNPTTAHIKTLLSTGQFHKAFISSETQWGKITNWHTEEQFEIAIRLYNNLGGDRKSDAILLKLWRNHKSSYSFLKMLFYKLHRNGPIRAQEFLDANKDRFKLSKDQQSELLGFRSIIQRYYKNYSASEALLNKAINLSTDDPWLTSTKIRLLVDLEQNELAKQSAIKHFDATPTPSTLQLLAYVINKVDGSEAQLTLLADHIDKFESAELWLYLAQLSANGQHWASCQQAIDKYHSLRICSDKNDEQTLLSLNGQLAIHHNDIDKAIYFLSQAKSEYWKIVADNLTQNNAHSQNTKTLPVPFKRQEYMTCAPTTLSCIAEYWGTKIDPKLIADQICFDGTPDTKERQWIIDNGFSFKEFELNESLPYELIDAGIPFAMVTTSGFSSHIQAVIGYNARTGTIYVMDPSYSETQEYLIKETIESERFNGARCIAFVPNAIANQLDNFDFPASTLYERYNTFRVAKENNDYPKAEAALTELRSHSPEQRLTLLAERQFAIWNNDNSEILRLNELLLASYPNELALINSKYYCLRDLGKRKEGIEYLSNYIKKYKDTDLTSTLFNEIYRTNEFPELIVLCLRILKDHAALSSAAQWVMAHYYWAEQDYKQAFEYYTNAHCLENTHPDYIDSFFKAARYLGYTEGAIELLKQRHQTYKIRSPQPAINLFKVYELLDQEHKGIDLLIEAQHLHPEDSELMAFLCNQLIDLGELELFEAMRSNAERCLGKDDYTELLARFAEKNDDLRTALEFYQLKFSINPFIAKYANGFMRTLHKQGNTQQIDQILESLYKQHPENTLVLDYIVDWHDDILFREKVLQSFIIIRPDYSIIRRQLIDIYLELNKFDLALALAKQTCKQISSDNHNWAYLAHCYQRLNDNENSILYAKRTLKDNIDNRMAFDALNAATSTEESKLSALEFIYDNIKTQQSFGDAIWCFWFEIKSVYSKQHLAEFIEFLQKNYSHIWQTYSIKALFHKQFGDIDSGIESLTLGITKHPFTPRLSYDLAEFNELKGNIDGAIDAYKKALSINPYWSDVSKQLYKIYVKEHDQSAAVSVIQNAIKRTPNDGILHGYLGDIYIQLDDKSQALRALTTAIKYEPNYHWAWENIQKLSMQLNQQEYAIELASQQCVQKPYQAYCWNNLALITTNAVKKHKYWKQGLSCDQYCSQIYSDKLEYLIETGQYNEALEIFDSLPWKEHPPFELMTQKVDLLVEIGDNKNAIETLTKLLSGLHGYAYLWRKLFYLLKQTNQIKTLINTALKAIKDNQFDPNLLCYASEALWEHGDPRKKQIALQHLEKACQLSPNEEYIALTFVDCLTQDKNFEKAMQVLEKFNQYHQVNYAQARRVGIYCALGQLSNAQEAFDDLIENYESDYWCIDEAFKAIKHKDNNVNILQVFRSNFEQLDNIQAYFYAEKRLELSSSASYQHVLKDLKSDLSETAWEGTFIAIIDYWSDCQASPEQKIIDDNLHRIIKSNELISKLVYCFGVHEHFHSTLKLMPQIEHREQLPLFVFYQYSHALQMLNQWELASQVILDGLKAPSDDSIHNLRVWYAYDLIRTNRHQEANFLHLINYEELVDIEKYTYHVIEACLQIESGSLSNQESVLAPLLEQCKSSFENVAGHRLCEHAKSTLKKQLMASLENPTFVDKLKQFWWIFTRA
ncbi:hypothetical protein SOPP22_03955 [Shewanella sp. OPT22]|nr:hypothetical protein SOPP22_03955 [Shewanella sp. OPT22]